MYEAMYGLGGALAIRELVDMIKPMYAGKSYAGLMNILTSIIVGIVLMVGLAWVTGRTLEDGLYYGLVAGCLAPIWNTALKIAKA